MSLGGIQAEKRRRCPAVDANCRWPGRQRAAPSSSCREQRRRRLAPRLLFGAQPSERSQLAMLLLPHVQLVVKGCVLAIVFLQRHHGEQAPVP